ncbi:MAG: hypothetical protein ACLTLY_00135 [Agathobacter rectalis]
MKASHRKDVIIARLIFAAICLFLIALIVTIVITVNSKGSKKRSRTRYNRMQLAKVKLTVSAIVIQR